ncbi:hypothetical protein K438DRAFT_1781878 [Mycena galopus ATCC 62051]|nr:hypothetical protein K438DRAFT_1781878 [Mycena galopus ATCC 62051]
MARDGENQFLPLGTDAQTREQLHKREREEIGIEFCTVIYISKYKNKSKGTRKGIVYLRGIRRRGKCPGDVGVVGRLVLMSTEWEREGTEDDAGRDETVRWESTFRWGGGVRGSIFFTSSSESLSEISIMSDSRRGGGGGVRGSILIFFTASSGMLSDKMGCSSPVVAMKRRRLLQDTVDTTALTGRSITGCVLRVKPLTGRRPLSALVVVHVFQCRRLVRRWHEDFPAIHTEGSLPGSKSAGIVAFIRERLLDLGEDPHAPTDSDHPDIEAQTSLKGEGLDEEEDVPILARSHETQTYSKFTSPKLGYLRDEIPLLDVDLGMDEILDNNKISGRSMG